MCWRVSTCSFPFKPHTTKDQLLTVKDRLGENRQVFTAVLAHTRGQKQ